MSDFDKEAEREKLREKYERDKKERKATQRMSDLLLKGATMTNAHCGTCGDPLFQMDGTTFCPSCHGNPDAVEGTGLEAESAEETAANDDDGAAATTDRADSVDRADAPDEAAADSGTGTGVGADGADSEIDVEPTSDTTSTSTPAAGQRRDEREQPTSSRSVAEPSDRRAPRSPADGSSADAGTRRRAPASSPSSVDGDLETARDALVRTLEKFAEEAAATDDPRYARECLEAAREAGETLSTLR